MKAFPKGELEIWRAILRVLIIFLGMSLLAILLFEHLRFVTENDFGYAFLRTYGWILYGQCEQIAFVVQTMIAGTIVCISFCLLFFRDTHYGWTGICIAILSFALWRYPSKAKPRAESASTSVEIAAVFR